MASPIPAPCEPGVLSVLLRVLPYCSGSFLHVCADQFLAEDARGRPAGLCSAVCAALPSGALPCEFQPPGPLWHPARRDPCCSGGPLLCAGVRTHSRLEAGVVVRHLCFSGVPVLPELQWVQTWVFSCFRRGVSPAPAPPLDSGEQPRVLELLVLASVSQWALESPF